MSDQLALDRLNIHQVTLNQCDLRESVECLARHGVQSTAVWIAKLEETGTAEARRVLDDNGMGVTSICPGGLVTAVDAAGMDAAIEQNQRWIGDAAAIGAQSMVTITGGLPEGSLDLEATREKALEGLSRLVPIARAADVRLALEPLHPMVCGYRSVVSSIDEALHFLKLLDADDVMGIAFDTYALWWEAELEAKIARVAPHLLAFHVSDWLPDTSDVRVDRGMPGDGRIDNRRIRG